MCKYFISAEVIQPINEIFTMQIRLEFLITNQFIYKQNNSINKYNYQYLFVSIERMLGSHDTTLEVNKVW